MKDRIQLQLFDHNRFAEDYVAPIGVTQEGISKAVSIRVHHVTQYVKPLILDGLVEERSSHIQRRARKRKVYFLTPEGRLKAASLRSHILKIPVPFRSRNGKVEESTLSEVFQDHRRDSTLLQLLNELDSMGYISEVVEKEAEEPVDFTQEAPNIGEFYGRELDLEATIDALDEAPFVVVTGIAGIGKSTLGASVCERLRGHRSLFWRQIRSWETAIDLAFRFATFLKALGKLGLHGYLHGPRPKELSLVEDLLTTDFAGVNALLVLDDVHDASEDCEAFLSILFNVLKQHEGVRALLLSRQVPEFYSQREVKIEGTIREIHLGGLDEESSLALLADAGFPESFDETVLEAGGGNPLFLKLLASTRSLAKHESLRTLEAYVSEEIEPELGRGERRCMEVASFYHIPVPSSGLLLEAGVGRKTLVSLEKKGLLEVVNHDRYVLHALLQNYFEKGLALERRRKLIPQVVEWIMDQAEEEAGGGNPQRSIELIGNALVMDLEHLQRATNLERMGRYRRVLGDFPGAEKAYRKSCGLFEEAQDLVRIHRKIALCLAFQGLLEESEAEVEEGLKLLPEEVSLERGWLLYQKAFAAFRREDYDIAAKLVKDLVSWVPSLPRDPNLLGALYNIHGLIQIYDIKHPDPPESYENLKRAASEFRDAGDQRGLSVAYNNLGLASLQLQNVEEALEHFDRSAEVAEKSGDIPSREMALFSKAFCLMNTLGDYEAAESLYQETYKMAKETHQRIKVVFHHWHFSTLYRHQGRYEESRESLEHFLESSEGMINEATRVANLSLLSRTCLLCGDQNAAKGYLKEAKALLKRSPSPTGRYETSWAEGSLKLFRGDIKGAETNFAKALELSEQGENGEFLLDYGRFLVSADRKGEARDIYRSIQEEFSATARPLELAAAKELASLGEESYS